MPIRTVTVTRNEPHDVTVETYAIDVTKHTGPLHRLAPILIPADGRLVEVDPEQVVKIEFDVEGAVLKSELDAAEAERERVADAANHPYTTVAAG